jgi:hypothetical protein
MSKDPITISVANDFSRFPGGRYRTDGPYSAEAFRDDLLVPALQQGGEVRVVLKGAVGYPATFLEEAFGGLVRVHGLDCANLKLISHNPFLQAQIVGYITDAQRAKGTSVTQLPAAPE